MQHPYLVQWPQGIQSQVGETGDTQHATARDKQEYVVETRGYTKPMEGKGGQGIKKGADF